MDLSIEADKRGKGLRILVTRLRFLGDIIITTAALSVLRERYPDASIYYLAEEPYSDILESNPCLDGIVRLKKGAAGFLTALREIRRLRLTAAIDLFYNPTSANLLFLSRIPVRIGGRRGWRRRLYTDTPSIPEEVRSAVDHHIHMMRAVDCEMLPRKPKVYLSDNELIAGRKNIDALFDRKSSDTRVIAFHPGGTWQAKRWPAKNFAALADLIDREIGGSVLLIVGPGEDGIARRIVDESSGEVRILSPGSIRIAAAAMAACEAVVANDGGIMHLAVALDLPTVGIFGPTEKDIWFPYEGAGPFSLATLDCDCSPCHLHQCEDKRCLDRLDPAEVMVHLRKVST